MSNYSVFIDFDYTVTTDDVGNRLYTYFSGGKNEPLVEKWLKRELPTSQCLRQEAALCRGSREEFLEYAGRFEIDPGFPKILKICREFAIPISIISDGLDVYIEHILGGYGLLDIPIYCNRGFFENNGLRVELTDWTEACEKCGNCKGERVKALKRPDDRAIYIGDGLSDLCGCRESDIIFAKDDLADFLGEEGIDSHRFECLTEVAEGLERLFSNVNLENSEQRG